MTNLFIIFIAIISITITYSIIKFKSTEYKYKELFILKDLLLKEELKFDKIEGIESLNGDRVWIEKKDKYVFNKLVSSEITLKESYQYDGIDNENY